MRKKREGTDVGYPEPVAPGSGRFEVWGERDGRLYRYCATQRAALEHIETLKRFDRDNSWSASPQEYRVSPNDGNGRCPGCGDPVPGSLPRNSTCDDCSKQGVKS
jgi:hypothetical protein